jgi:hypothetical protein
MRQFLILLSFTILFSCNNNSSKEVIEEDTTFTEEEFASPEERLLWIPVYDTLTGDFKLQQQRQFKTDTLKAETLVSDINGAWENVKLVFKKISNDTIYVGIPDAEFLTQRMGSSGAASYISSTTFILTELPGIRFVNYDFEEGDHLSPGTMERTDFKDYR